MTETSVRHGKSQPAADQGQDGLGRFATGFALSLGITSVFNGLLVVVKETNEETVLAWLKAATGHHWVTQGIIDIAVFVVMGFLLTWACGSWRSRPNTVIAVAVGGIVVGGLIIVGFFA